MNAEKPPRALPLRVTPRRAALLLIALVLIIGLGWLLRDFVRGSILLPLIDLGWAIWVFLQSVPQFVFWALFLLGALVLAGRSLLARRGAAAGENGPKMVRHRTLSRYRYWQRGLESMDGNAFSRERILRDLQLLVLQVLAEHDRIDLDAVRARLVSGELDLSGEAPAIRALLDSAQRRSLVAQGDIVQPSRLRAWLARLLGRPPAPAAEHAIDVLSIVAWLEKETGRIEPE